MPPDSPAELAQRAALRKAQAWENVRRYNQWSELDVALGRTPKPPAPEKPDLIVEGIFGSFKFFWRLITAIIILLAIPTMIIAFAVGVPAMVIFISTASPATLLAVIVIMLIFP